jgi:hypothetical protein
MGAQARERNQSVTWPPLACRHGKELASSFHKAATHRDAESKPTDPFEIYPVWDSGQGASEYKTPASPCPHVISAKKVITLLNTI